METFDCPPNTQCPPPGTATTDYLRMRMGHGQRYTQMYTTKELQTGEYWDASVSTGLEMYDFDARFYDPQLGRWFVGDPAEQFHNPYLAMGNNPVVYVDPDGEFVHLIIGAAIGGMMNLIMNADNIENPGQFFAYFGVGALAGALGAGVGAGVSSGLVTHLGGSFAAGFAGTTSISSTGFAAGFITGAASGVTNGFITGTGNALVGGENIGDALSIGLYQAGIQGLSGAFIGGVIGGIQAANADLNFWTGQGDQDLILHIDEQGRFNDNNTVDNYENSNPIDQKHYKTNLSSNPSIQQIRNSDGTYTTYIEHPKSFKISAVEMDLNAGLISYEQVENTVYSVTTFNKPSSAVIYGTKTYGRPINGFKDLIGGRTMTWWMHRN